MRYLILSFLLFSCTVCNATNPGLQWAGILNYNAYINRTVTDAAGYSYLIGRFTHTVDVDPGAGVTNVTNNGAQSLVFVSKIDPSGNLVWYKQFATGAYGTDIAVTTTGNIVATGTFTDSADFDPGPGVYELRTLYRTGMWILEMDAQGNFIWADAIGYDSQISPTSITTDNYQNIIVTGAFTNVYMAPMDVDPGAAVYNVGGGQYGPTTFMLKLNSNGTFNRFKYLATSVANLGTANITVSATDSVGNIYLGGNFKGVTNFETDTSRSHVITSHYINSNYISDMFIMKVDTAGNFLWVKNMGGNVGQILRHITSDGDGIYLTGYFQNVAVFDPDGGQQLVATGITDRDAFAVKWNGDGSFGWVKQMGGTLNDEGMAIAVDHNQNSYITGYFTAIANFGTATDSVLFSQTGLTLCHLCSIQPADDIYMAELDPDGKLVFAKQIGGIADDIGHDIALDSAGSIYVSGSFYDTVDFDPGPGIDTIRVAANQYNLSSYFILKYNHCDEGADQTVGGCDSVAVNGRTYHASATFTAPFYAVDGCDSTMHYNVVVSHSSTTNIQQHFCDSAAYTFNGITYDISGAYTQQLSNVYGCDSTLLLNLNFGFSNTSTVSSTACNSYSFNGHYYNTSGNYVEVLTNASGCDSTISLALTIDTVNNAVNVTGQQLTAQQADATYQWVLCPGYNPLPGAVGQGYTGQQGQAYAVIINTNVCADTSNCITVANTGLNDLNGQYIDVYPVPTTGNLNLVLNTTISNLQVNILNGLGQLLNTETFTGSSNNYTISLAAYADGFYFVELKTANSTRRIKVLKQ